jgi:hypothetical protein
MAKSIECARRDVQHAFEEALAWADSDEQRRFNDLEKRLWTLLLALGRNLVVLFLLRTVHRPRAVEYVVGEQRYTLGNDHSSDIGTRFGKVRFTRPTGCKVGDSRAAKDLPVDRELGLCSSFSLCVVMDVARLCAQQAFASARKTFKQFCEWMPSPRAVLRIIDAVGAKARPFLEQAPAPEGDGEILVIQTDGKGAPTISSRERARRTRRRRVRDGKNRRHHRRARRHEHPRIRRKPGKKSKNAKVAAVGVLYTLRRTDEGLEGPVNKRIYATFTSYRALFTWLHAEAVKRGYGTRKFSRVLFLADGADVLWELQEEFFPDAEPCLDWYHVTEKLWKAGKCLHREGSRALEEWVNEQKLRLRRGSFDAVVTSLSAALEGTARTGPGNKYRRKVLAKTIAHFEKHRHRMRYQYLRRHDLDIATGVVEGAVRHVIGVRMDGPGMRWGLDRLEHVLHLRCILVNGMWDDFGAYLAAEQHVRLASKPTPARTHDAKPVKRAA